MTSSNSSTPSGGSCHLFHGDATKCEVLVDVKRVTASLSIIGSLFTLGLIILFRKYREMSQRMIANLSLASLLIDIAILINDISTESTWVCRLQGAMLTLLIWAIFLWILCILFNLYLQLLFEFEIRKYEIPVTIFCWVFPMMLTGLPFIDDAYAPAGVWCWVKNDFKWRFVFWYIWRMLFIVVMIVVTAHMAWKLRKMRGLRHSSTMSRSNFESDLKTLRLYPFVYFVLNLFPVASRLYSAIEGSDGDNQYNFVLLLLQVITDPIIGATVAVVYVLDSRTRKSLTLKNVRLAFQKWRTDDSQVQEYSGPPETAEPTQPTVRG